MVAVTISEYWHNWLLKVKASGVRQSKAEVVHEGLKRIKNSIDLEIEEFEEARKLVREGHNES